MRMRLPLPNYGGIELVFWHAAVLSVNKDRLTLKSKGHRPGLPKLENDFGLFDLVLQ